MKEIIVIISTYNGSESISRQLDSIFEQEKVNTQVLIRDDGSTDNTIDVINDYITFHPDRRIELIIGDNEGYAKSFWDALRASGEADYYAFSDQDDVWKKDKLVKTIAPMEKDQYQGAKLSYCKMIRCDEKMKVLSEQVEVCEPQRLSKKICLTKTYNYGAATVFNREAKSLICRSWPDANNVPHDFWAGLLCYWFGHIYFIDEFLYYWIRNKKSVTGEGTKLSGQNYRIAETINRRSYPNVAQTLLDNYVDLLDGIDKDFLERLVNYKNSLKDKIRIITDLSFRRDSIKGSVILKLGVLFNWF